MEWIVKLGFILQQEWLHWLTSAISGLLAWLLTLIIYSIASRQSLGVSCLGIHGQNATSCSWRFGLGCWLSGLCIRGWICLPLVHHAVGTASDHQMRQ